MVVEGEAGGGEGVGGEIGGECTLTTQLARTSITSADPESPASSFLSSGNANSKAAAPPEGKSQPRHCAREQVVSGEGTERIEFGAEPV